MKSLYSISIWFFCFVLLLVFLPVQAQERYRGSLYTRAVLNAEYITEHALPTLLFHGVKNRLVPFGKAPHHFCDGNFLGVLPLDGKHEQSTITLTSNPQ